MSTQNDCRHPAIDVSKRTNDLAKKLTQLARMQASSLHSSASAVDSIKSAGLSTPASYQSQDGLSEQILAFCSRVPALVASFGLMKPLEPADANQEPALAGMLRIAEQANKSLLPSQNFAIVERIFDSLLKQHARTIADRDESIATIQKIQLELARSKRDDLLRNWQDEAKRNADNTQAKIDSMQQEISFLKDAAREFDAKESSLKLENKRLIEELRHAGRQESRPANSADHSALEAKLMLADATIMSMRAEMKRDVLQLDTEKVKKLRLLGSGSFADVHESLLEVRCAVKTLKESVRSNMYEVDKFRREASMLRSLRHPGVLRVIAVNDAKFAIAIEIMAGGSLHSLLHGTSQSIDLPTHCLPLPYILSLAMEIADTLKFLHLCGVVHRDVKPENLMFDGSSRLKLCDFGLAAEKIGQFVKTRSNLAGTPRYMAPEAFRNEPCSEKIDIFAFGMILWEMYTGRLPWAGRSFSEVRSCVSSGTERPAIPSSAPPELALLISDCWAHDPQHRPDAASILLRLAAIKESIAEGEDPRLASFSSPGPQLVSSGGGRVAEHDEEAIC